MDFKTICEREQVKLAIFFFNFFIIYIDNNGDDIQSTEETIIFPDNYEEDKTQDATKKPEDKII